MRPQTVSVTRKERSLGTEFVHTDILRMNNDEQPTKEITVDQPTVERDQK